MAKAIDSTSNLDEKLQGQNWLKINVERVLANRSGVATVGSTLVHSTGSWHSQAEVNKRYQHLFQRRPFSASQVEDLEKLWILRHSVAHNAGMIIHYDAARIGDETLANCAADIDAEFIKKTFLFLSPIAESICTECGESLLRSQFQPLSHRGPDYISDKSSYSGLKYLSKYVDSRVKDLPSLDQSVYETDFNIYSAPP